MKTSWTDGIDETRQKEIKQNFKESAVMRRRLVELLTYKILDSSKQSRAKSDYESPNWAYLQADARGYERALQDAIALITEV